MKTGPNYEKAVNEAFPFVGEVCRVLFHDIDEEDFRAIEELYAGIEEKYLIQ